jgi:tripartite-type tricarboxylate transporter receptor subunit TctC
MGTSSTRCALISALIVAALWPALAWAQAFPNRPIKLIVPFAAGGAADLFGRSLANGLSGELGQQVVVEPRAGAGGLTGLDAVAKSSPDGYTICLAGAAALSAIPFMVSKMPFDWQKDLALLTLVVRVPEVLTVHPSVGVNTFGDFVSYARAYPGKINFGSAGAGSITHLAGELFKTEVKLNLVHVPYRGIGPGCERHARRAYPDDRGRCSFPAAAH